jgi:hypothetical protein
LQERVFVQLAFEIAVAARYSQLLLLAAQQRMTDQAGASLTSSFPMLELISSSFKGLTVDWVAVSSKSQCARQGRLGVLCS